jgi:hypothetical protein
MEILNTEIFAFGMLNRESLLIENLDILGSSEKVKVPCLLFQREAASAAFVCIFAAHNLEREADAKRLESQKSHLSRRHVGKFPPNKKGICLDSACPTHTFYSSGPEQTHRI